MADQHVEKLSIGEVDISRKEGKWPIRCLEFLKAQLPNSASIVYVNSGSTNGSIEADMTLHNVTILYFSYWWQRSVLAGMGYFCLSRFVRQHHQTVKSQRRAKQLAAGTNHFHHYDCFCSVHPAL